MNLLFAAIGSLIGASVFVIADYRILGPTFVCLFISSLAFTTLSKYRKEILSLLSFVLIMFFNYNFRAEYLQYLDPSKIYIGKEAQYFKVETDPSPNKFFQDEFIVRLKKRSPNIKDNLQDYFVPYRFLVINKSGKGFKQGDILSLNEEAEFKALSKFKSKILKKEKVFFELENKDLRYEKHEKSLFNDLREQFKRYFLLTLGKEKGLITTSLLFGSQVAKIPHDISQDIQRLGLSHIFAASGFHLMLLAGILQLIFLKLKFSSKLSSVLIIISSFIYSGFAGFSPSILRSAICISAFYITKLANRKINSLKLLSSLAGIVIFIDPYSILDLGLQFSYLATLAILIWGEPIKNRLNKHSVFKTDDKKNKDTENKILSTSKSYFLESLALSLAVQILLAPLTLYYFKTFPVWSLIANLIFTPILSLVIVLAAFGLSFLIAPILNICIYLFQLSEYLPFINYKVEFSFPCLIILFLLLNLLAAFYCYEDFIQSKALRLSMASALLLLLAAKTLPVYGVQEFYVYHHHFDSFIEKEIQLMKHEHKDYRYFHKAGLKGLILNKVDSLKDLEPLNGRLKEIHLLILPNLNARSIYLSNVIKVLKPQFIIINSKSQSHRVKENLDFLKDESHVIFNEGKLVVSDNKYWRIYN